MLRTLLLVALLLPAMARAGDDYSEPARGTALRAALLDAIRPHAEWMLGQPVEFVVEDLRAGLDTGFAILHPQRPGGQAIDLATTPMVRRGGAYEADMMDGTTMHVLYQKSGATWVAVHWSIGATDVWWSDPDLCVTFQAVTPEYCY
jgi:hypothetical protein